MEYRGKVKDGVIVLEHGALLAEGTEVTVAPRTAQVPPATTWEKLRSLSGSASGLPTGAARQHDYYLYGTPKK
jgi:hypothetical protein